MTQDEIIAWAKEFGLQVKPPSWGYSDAYTIGNIYVEHLEVLVKFAAAKEREACAKHLDDQNTAMTDKLAAEIRARGKA